MYLTPRMISEQPLLTLIIAAGHADVVASIKAPPSLRVPRLWIDEEFATRQDKDVLFFRFGYRKSTMQGCTGSGSEQGVKRYRKIFSHLEHILEFMDFHHTSNRSM